MRKGQIIDITGQRFGRWIALELAPKRNNSRHTFFKCKCDCGTIKNINGTSLRLGATRSCGCLQIDAVSTHRMKYTPEYRVWHSIKQRCFNKKTISYHNYGGRGISVCPRWLETNGQGFINFVEDVGLKPKPYDKYSFDRIDNDGNYEPTNVRWATRSEQQYNRRPVKTIQSFSDEDLLSELSNRGFRVLKLNNPQMKLPFPEGENSGIENNQTAE